METSLPEHLDVNIYGSIAVKIDQIITYLAELTAVVEAMVREIIDCHQIYHSIYDGKPFPNNAVHIDDIKTVAQAHGITVN